MTTWEPAGRKSRRLTSILKATNFQSGRISSRKNMTTLTIMLVSCLSLVTSILVLGAYSASINRRKIMECSEIPTNVLSEILGPAFNSRYMSVSEPQENEMDAVDTAGIKRAPIESSFYVDDQFAHEISDTPAWKTNHLKPKRSAASERGLRIDKRAAKPVRQWDCQSKIRWHDLGPDYYPRYLRSVECTSQTCWYDMMQCRPRSFTVKLLRRKRDRCVEDNGFKVGNIGLPHDLRELWVWEERAVNFCCDCAL